MTSISKASINPWRAITLEELQQHDDLDNRNAWIAIRGIVYDVSDFAAVHPGGSEKIRKYAGKDATEAFTSVHPYVDIDSYLSECQVAILKDHPEAPKRGLLKAMNCFELKCLGGRGRYAKPITYFKQDSIVGIYTVEFNYHSQECDWTIGIKEKRFLLVFKYIDSKKAWMAVYELPEPIYNDDIEVEHKNNHAHVDITIRKPIPATVWAKQTHGLRDCGNFVNINTSHGKFDAFISFKKCLTSNVILFGIQIADSARIGVPIGFCVNLHIDDVSRPYTPVCLGIVEDGSSKPPDNGSTAIVLYFMIKIYQKGKLTRALDAIELDDGNQVATLQVSTPYGYFNKDFLSEFCILMLIAGGTGLTPMVKMIKSFWVMKERMHAKRVALIHFVEKEHDLIWRKQFHKMDTHSSFFYYFPTLTNPSSFSHWKGLTGRITQDLVTKCMNEIVGEKVGLKKACICGPPGFNSASVKALSGTIDMDNIFVFSN